MCSPPTTSLSDTQLCCRGGRLVRGVCMHSIEHVCVCVCATCTMSLGTSRGLTDYLSRSRLEGSLSLSLCLSPFLSSSHFSLITHSLHYAPLKVTATLQMFGRYMIPGAQG